jgi:hypothetical protein
MKNPIEGRLKKLMFPVAMMLVSTLVYVDHLKNQRIDAEERQRLVDEVNAREEQLNEELQPLIERNKSQQKRSDRTNDLPI